MNDRVSHNYIHVSHMSYKDEVTSRIGFLLILELAITYASDEAVCLASAATVKPAKCPEDRESWEKASVQKNCAAIQHNCSSFLYHCLLNPWWNETIEVCAPSILVLGGYCSEFNYGPNRILPTNHANGPSCSKFSPPCPSYYKSTEGYKYPGCFRIKQDEKILIITQTPNSSEHFRSSAMSTEEYESRTSSSTDVVPVVPDVHRVNSRLSPHSSLSEGSIVAIVFATIVAIIIMIMIVLISWKMKQQSLSFAEASKVVICFWRRENTSANPRASVAYLHDQENEINIGMSESLDPLLSIAGESIIPSGDQSGHSGLADDLPQSQVANVNISMDQTSDTNHPDEGTNLTDENNDSSSPLNRTGQEVNMEQRTSVQSEPNQNCAAKTVLTRTEKEGLRSAQNFVPNPTLNSTSSQPSDVQQDMLAEESHTASTNIPNPSQNLLDLDEIDTAQVVSSPRNSSAPVSCSSPEHEDSILRKLSSAEKQNNHPNTLPPEGAISHPEESFSDGQIVQHNDSANRDSLPLNTPVMVTEGSQNCTDDPPIQLENLLADVEITEVQPLQGRQTNATQRVKLGRTVPTVMAPSNDPQEEDSSSDTEFKEKVLRIVNESLETKFHELQLQLLKEIEKSRTLQQKLDQKERELFQKEKENFEKDKAIFELQKELYESKQRIKELERELQELKEQKRQNSL